MTDHASLLYPLLERQTSGYLDLLRLLNDEHQALAKRDVAALEQITVDKKQCVDRLEGDGRSLLALFPQHAGGAPKPGIDSLLRDVPEIKRAPLRARWVRLTDLARQCERQNRINGRIVERNRQQAERILRLLKGQSEAPEAYASDGKYALLNAPRPLGTV